MNTYIQRLKRLTRRTLELPKTRKFRHLNQPGVCSVCGSTTQFLAATDNLKESLHCKHCHAWFRIRMLSEVLIELYSKAGSRSLRQLVEEPAMSGLALYEAQASGALHDLLERCPGYVCSEFFPDVEPGSLWKGTRCEDLQALSFEDASLDLVLHTSVLEHVPDPERAFDEALRVLRPGGRLVFEVPMTDLGSKGLREVSVRRARLENGELHHMLEPSYHDDPLDPKGVLVFTDFGTDVGEQLCEAGFEVDLHTRELEHSSMSHAVVIVAQKPMA